jgi:hypothetical protein
MLFAEKQEQRPFQQTSCWAMTRKKPQTWETPSKQQSQEKQLCEVN